MYGVFVNGWLQEWFRGERQAEAAAETWRKELFLRARDGVLVRVHDLSKAHWPSVRFPESLEEKEYVA